MMNSFVQFSTTDIPETRREISERFISWGSVGTQFLLDEHRTNKYGYSDISGAVNDMSYPNWQEQNNYSTITKGIGEKQLDRITFYVGDSYRKEEENRIKRDQEAVEGFILKRYQMWYFRKCSELNELIEEEK